MKINDKVKLSENALSNFSGSFKEFMAKHVYQIVGKEVSILQGIVFKTHCGTTLRVDECEKVSDDTQIFT